MCIIAFIFLHKCLQFNDIVFFLTTVVNYVTRGVVYRNIFWVVLTHTYSLPPVSTPFQQMPSSVSSEGRSFSVSDLTLVRQLLWCQHAVLYIAI